jgi:transcriptional regulator with XRE-family HTH domain
MTETKGTIEVMSTYKNDSTGKRIAWLRKQKGMSGHALADAVGVRNVYISQIENDRYKPSRNKLVELAALLDTTVGFLLMETDDPAQVSTPAEPGPVYWSEEADAAAKLIDAMPPDERKRMLAVLQTLVDTAAAITEPQEVRHSVVQSPKEIEPLQQRLILGEYFGGQRQRSGV